MHAIDGVDIARASKPQGMSDARRDRRLVPVPAAIRDHVVALVHELGPRAAGRQVGVSRDTAVAIAAGLDVMPGTLALARAHMPSPSDRPPPREVA